MFHFHKVSIQQLLLAILRFLDGSGLIIFPLLLLDDVSQHVTLSRCEFEIGQRSVPILVQDVNVVEDLPGIQQHGHRCAFGFGSPFLSASDEVSQFFFISLIIIVIRRNREYYLFLGAWTSATTSGGLFLQERRSS